MDRVCEELDEAKLEIEKLKAGYATKSEQHENLKKAYNEQLSKLQEANSRLENNERELIERAEEVSMLKIMYEEVKHNLAEKESVVKRLSVANDKLRAESGTGLQKLDEENRSLILAAEEANMKCEDRERKIKSLEEENNSLKGLLDSSHKKCSEAEHRARAPKELRDRDDAIFNLEEEVRKLKDGLKWKTEQFKHLEEAYVKLRDQYRTEKKEWESEKSTLLDEMGSLQERLDSQIRISEDLGKKLEMCNRALAHEEGRRKALEVQLSDFKKQFENVFAECEEAKFQLENVMGSRDEEIASLRHSLSTKMAIYKEVEYRAIQLETENKELLASLKELREAQICEGGNSLAKLKNRLKTVEQTHRDCSSNLRAKEAEWSSKVEKLMTDLNECRFELASKGNELEEAEKELERSESSLMNLMVENEEIHLMLLVLKSGIYEAQTKLQGQVMEDKASLLTKQLETKNEDLAAAQREVIEEHKKMKAQLERHKEILEEALQMESASEEIIRVAYETLDRTNAELAEKICEANETEFELQIWKSTAERLRIDLEESQCLRKEIEASLLAQAEVEDAMKRETANLTEMLAERDRRIGYLEQKIVLTEQEINKGASGENPEDVIFEDMLREAFQRELEGTMVAQISTERAFERERNELFELMEAKDQRIKDLLHTMISLEQKFDSSSFSFSSQLAEKLAEIDLLHEAWDRITATEILAELETEEKKMMVGELENEVNALISKLESQGESLLDSKKKAEEVEAALEAKELEMRKLACEAETRLKSSRALIDELKVERANLLGERESLLGFVKGLDDTIGECCNEDMVLMERLRNCLREDTETVDPLKENANGHYLGAVKRYEVTSNGRSPFRELNS
ncbi:uncharacterized protein At4g38062 [Punica granatum]|uniref:Uncharacterized protein n=2 Tax=Punica granatum TaxID=22663 RepID=A0A218XKL4_PUNGR|nr:uncharacterized protein At4g38062 [Punica granatum]OWM85414.1 hypothetical protein CDL15_Pgr019038 [Punica granatum]PKI42109.1 hypothetical protein CRG98_037562 [Punica granatum]